MSDPAPPYKGFLMLRDKRNPHLPYGWTESLWINQDTFKNSLAALEEIAVPRLAMLPRGFVIERLKVTNPLLPRCLVDHRNYYQAGRYEKDGRPPWALLLLRFQHDGFSTRYNLGGVPIDIASAEGVHAPPEWQAAFDQFGDLVKRHCVMVNEECERPGNCQKTPLSSITQDRGAARITAAVDCFDAADAYQRIRVKLSGVTQQPSLNGSRDVCVLDGRTVLTLGLVSVKREVSGGFVEVQKRKKVIHPISKVSLLKMSSRKRGYGHSYGSPGRRKRR